MKRFIASLKDIVSIRVSRSGAVVTVGISILLIPVVADLLKLVG